MNNVSLVRPTVDCRGRRTCRWVRMACLANLGLGLTASALLSVVASPQPIPEHPADLFQRTNVWTVHLRFTADQWEAMEPKGAAKVFPWPGGPRGFRPGGPGGPGPAMFLAPAFLKGGGGHNDQISRAEFCTLGEKWFTDWDTTHGGKLTEEQLRQGLVSILDLPRGPPGERQGGPPLQGTNGRNGLSAAAGINFEYVHADLDFGDVHLHDIAVRYKGNSTFMQARNSLKRSLKLDLNKYVKGQKLAGLTKLNLHNNVTDPSWMNEVLSYQLFRDAGVPAPRTSYARVYVTVPGKFDKKYLGLYSVVEDIDKHFAEEQFNSRKGAIFKPVTHDLFADLGEDWTLYSQIYDAKTELSETQKRQVIAFARFVTHSTDAEFAKRLGEYLDLDEFARFMSVTVWLSNLDSLLQMGQNFYVFLGPESGKFQFLPWDLDHSFGQFPMGGTQEQREHLSVQRPWRGNNRFLERVFKVDAFKTSYLARLTEFSKTLFLPDRFAGQVDEVAAAIRPAVREESETKLARFESVSAGNSVAQPGPDDHDRFGRRSEPIKPFVLARARSVNNQLQGKSDSITQSESDWGPGSEHQPPEGFGRGGGFGPGQRLAAAFMEGLDANHDEVISHAEFTNGFARWFDRWNSDKSGTLTAQQLRDGIAQDLVPFRGGPPDHGDFEPPDVPPPFKL